MIEETSEALERIERRTFGISRSPVGFSRNLFASGEPNQSIGGTDPPRPLVHQDSVHQGIVFGQNLSLKDISRILDVAKF